MATRYLPRFANLEQFIDWIVKHSTQERGLGEKGFSAALRMIIVYLNTLRRTAAMPRNLVGSAVAALSVFLGNCRISMTRIYLRQVEGQSHKSRNRVEALFGS